MTLAEAQNARAYWLACYMAAGSELEWEGRRVKPAPPDDCYREFQRMDALVTNITNSVSKPFSVAEFE